MRIISGAARGRKLKNLDGTEIKPTSDMVKESIFNIVQFDIEGRQVLDLFAGSGQLGLEALSRGARYAVFIDTDPAAQKLIKENIKLCGFTNIATVYRRDALDYLKRCEAFDLIFIDPPYASPFVGEALKKINEFDKLKTNGIIICEMRVDRQTPAVQPPYYMHKEYIYGNIKIIRYGRQ